MNERTSETNKKENIGKMPFVSHITMPSSFISEAVSMEHIILNGIK